MPTPASTSMSDINNHIGSSRNNLNDGYVRNLASRSSGSISFAQCRWGIQFPAYKGIDGSAVADYSTNGNISYTASHTFPAFWQNSQNYAEVAIYYNLKSDGTATIVKGNSQTGNFTAASWTWLQSGSNSQYYAQVNISSGSLHNSSSATGTDLILSTTRSWVVLARADWNGSAWTPDPATAGAEGTLTIKDESFNTLLVRSFSFTTTVDGLN